jgi:hypothetical protein
MAKSRLASDPTEPLLPNSQCAARSRARPSFLHTTAICLTVVIVASACFVYRTDRSTLQRKEPLQKAKQPQRSAELQSLAQVPQFDEEFDKMDEGYTGDMSLISSGSTQMLAAGGCLEWTRSTFVKWRRVICSEVNAPVCQDTPGFKGKHGHGCDEWDDVDCSTIHQQYADHYTEADQKEIVKNCPLSCRVCHPHPKPDTTCSGACTADPLALAQWECNAKGTPPGEGKIFKRWQKCVENLQTQQLATWPNQKEPI